MEQSVKYILLKQQQNQQRYQLDIIKKQQALLLMCRIYIGSINFELNEARLKEEFLPFGPVKAVSLTLDSVTNRHKGFVFLEFETPEAAQLSIEQMNGVILGGRNIKVGRPSNMPQAQPIIDQLTEEAKNYNRIYIASIHSDLTENDIQSLFEPFGKIISCTLAKDTMSNKHKGYGFIEFDTVQAAREAISSMNLFDLGGQRLRVGKSITPSEGLFASAQPVTSAMPTATALAVATITAQLQAEDVETKSQPTMTAPYSDTTAVTSMISNPTTAIQNLIPQSTVGNSSGIRSKFATSPASNISVSSSQVIFPPPSSIPKPSIPVGLKTELQQYPSISLVLPVQSEPINNQKIVSDSEDTLYQQEGLSIKGREQRHLLSQKLNQRRFDSRVCIIRNMANAEDVNDNLQHEVTEECSKYGDIIKVLFYTEQQENNNTEPIVKIFVEFKTSTQAEKAIDSLHGRRFDGRTIKVELYDQTAYQADDLSG
jgi:half-pint family poly-U binding splicing factor